MNKRVSRTPKLVLFLMASLTYIAQIGNEFSKIPWLTPIPKQASSSKIGVFVVERVLRRFHRIARELKHRHNNRPEFPVADEYDVQDLLRAILVGLFDDVRPEEYAPTYAGGASRMDFLIKAERLVVETKFAGASLKDKQLGEQLIVDIERYQSHPDCQRLVCFVYDPSGYVKNPSGLESDLSGKHGEIEVNVVVVSP